MMVLSKVLGLYPHNALQSNVLRLLIVNCSLLSQPSSFLPLPLQCPSSPTPKRKFYHGGTEAQRRKKKREFWQICDPLEDEGPPYLPKVCILEDTRRRLAAMARHAETTLWQHFTSIPPCFIISSSSKYKRSGNMNKIPILCRFPEPLPWQTVPGYAIGYAAARALAKTAPCLRASVVNFFFAFLS